MQPPFTETDPQSAAGAGKPELRVLNVLNELRTSGAETMLSAAADEWSGVGISARVLALAPEPGPYATTLRAAGYDVRNLWSRPPFGLLGAFNAELRRSRVDVVHLHAEWANFWLASVARSAGCGVVRSIHNVFGFSRGLRLERIAQRRLLHLIGVEMVAVGHSVQANEADRFYNRTDLISNWFDPVRFTARSESEHHAARAEILGASERPEVLVAVTVGNCSPAKNHSLLADAFAKLGDACEWRWLHVGQEDAMESERDLVRRLGIADRVSFLAPTVDVATVLAAADVYVMPSKFEGVSIAAIEAMARGVPVIFTDVPGLRDLKAESDAVTIVPCGSGDLASAIARYAALPISARQDLGASLAADVRSAHSMRRGVMAYADVYRRAFARRVHRPRV